MNHLKKTVLSAAVMTAAACILADVFLRNIGRLLALFGEETFAAIFGQLQDARILPGILIAAAVSALIAWAAGFIRRLAAKIPVYAVGFLAAWLGAVWFASVNGIRFGIVMRSLITLAASGALSL